MTSKQRAYLMSLASNLNPIFQVGKSSLTPELTAAIGEAFNNNELIKIGVLKNCFDDPRAIAEMVAERTHSQVVQVIGKKILLYKEGKKEKKKIQLPKKSPGKNRRDRSIPLQFRRFLRKTYGKEKQKNWHYGRHIRSHSYRSSDPWRGGVRAVRA